VPECRTSMSPEGHDTVSNAVAGTLIAFSYQHIWLVYMVFLLGYVVFLLVYIFFLLKY